MTFTVRLLSPDISQEITACNHVMLPAVNGDISILTGHSRLVTILKTGVFLEKTEKGWAPLANIWQNRGRIYETGGRK